MVEIKQSKTLKLDLGVYQHKQGVIAVTVDNKLLGQLSSDPKSKNYNEVLFKEFKALLVEAGKWQD
ncbi:hypothetical protein [Priestia megaterium]|uniref:hypothetical protein n=1 Tax=Priestia megaterium TaxID=1404 RepID=UPI002E233797|nr:hypothetical protein [Priestia megaterium]